MRAGRLNKRVELQSATETIGDAGNVTETWTAYATVWAEVQPLQGNERWQAQQVSGEVDHIVRMRYRSDLTAKHRLFIDPRILDIKAVLNVRERGRELEVLCKEQV